MTTCLCSTSCDMNPVGNCISGIEDKLVKLQRRAARAIVDVEFTAPSETMFTQLKWMTFP